jgi:putative sugar O-methyltransferase
MRWSRPALGRGLSAHERAAIGAMTTGRSADDQVAASIEAMRRDVAAAPKIYRPGAFWDDLIDANLAMLRTDGIANLKRTVANNYYNWIVTSPRDPQLQKAVLNWLRRPRLAPLRTKMEPARGLRTYVRDDAFELTPGGGRAYRFFVGMAWERARQEDQLGLTDRLSEPEVGNPIRIRRGSRLISQDLANSIIECTFAARSGCLRDGARIAELGAGYGRLAHVYSQVGELTYCIFDIPPALAISQWYIGEVLGRNRIVPYRREPDFATTEAKLRPGVVAFFTPDQLEHFPDGWFDLTQTISTLPEMPERQSAHLLGLLADKSSDALFLKQWQRWRNDADHVELTEENYRLPAPWHLADRRVDPIQPAFFNQLWRR